MQEAPDFIRNHNKSLDWDNKVLRRKSHHFLWMSSVDVFFLKKTNSESVLDDKKDYEMLPMKIFQKNIQTGDLFPIKPEVPK